MKRYLFPTLFCLLMACTEKWPDGESQYRSFAPDGIPFTVADSAWNVDMLGSHRAIVSVGQSGAQKAVRVTLPWRRPDMRIDAKKIIVMDVGTGQEVKNVSVIDFTSERGVIAFQPPTVPGKYEVYYLPAKFRKGYDDARWGKYNDYLPPEYDADPDWEKEIKSNPGVIPEAKLIRFEARTKFDFFTNMGLIATEKEIQELKRKSTDDYLLFPEDRAYPIRLTTIPVRWVKKLENGAWRMAHGRKNKFEGFAAPNEYYTWQIGIWSADKPLNDVRLTFSDFTHTSGDVVSREEVTCFNLGGTNWDGRPVAFRVDVPQAKVQALWCGLQIPATVRGGKYRGTATVTAEGVAPQTVDITIHTGKEELADKGDGDLWRHARLRWLNSTIGMDDLPVFPYDNMEIAGNRVTATGKTLEVASNGLPKSIEINGRQVLHFPVAFVVETHDGSITFDAENLQVEKKADGLVQWEASSEQGGLHFKCSACMEFDGYVRYHVRLSAEQALPVNDVRLVTSYTPAASDYFMGIGLKGGTRPAKHVWDWKGHWDSYWIGGDKAGLHVELRGAAYHGPLMRDYYAGPPKVWDNAGKGRITVSGNKNQPANVVASTGNQVITPQPLDFEFALLITPVKPVNTAKHFSERYFHSQPDDFAKAAGEGANIANIHHSLRLNPYINYPFHVREPLVKFVEEQHAANRKVKLYYTIRELSNYTSEIYALKSLNHEILIAGAGYGPPWLCEHLIDDYWPAWYTELPGQQADAALVLNGFSRWINYYLEGLRWMFEHYGIDGIYMDDVSFDREVMKRIRKIMARYRPTAIIDLHSCSDYSNGPANQYTDFFPYIDRLWFGEAFKYNIQLDDARRMVCHLFGHTVRLDERDAGGRRKPLSGYGVRHHCPSFVWYLARSRLEAVEGFWD